MEIEKELKEQKELIKEIKEDIKKIKRFYFTSLVIKILVIVIPIVGLAISIPWIIDFYENLSSITI
jgi:hypothetical protein